MALAVDPQLPYNGPMIDAHHHLWDPTVNYHPWLSGTEVIPFRYGDYTVIKRRYFPDDYFRDADGHDVKKTVYVETEWDPKDPIGEVQFISEVATKYGLPNAVVGQAWLNRADIETVLAGEAAFPLVRSVRHKPGGAASPAEAKVGRRTLMSDEKWRQGYALLEKYHLRFDLQTPWWNLHEAVALARDFPRTTIVLNHTGLPADRSPEGLADWHKAMSAFAWMPNVAVKVSGIGQKGRPWTVEDNRWIVLETIAMFSPQRVMFGSNFPVDSLCGTYNQIMGGFKEITKAFSDLDKRAMFYGNAERFYDIR
jgi:predicted TIM-barrel fold metal-dependent hydrolase